MPIKIQFINDTFFIHIILIIARQAILKNHLQKVSMNIQINLRFYQIKIRIISKLLNNSQLPTNINKRLPFNRGREFIEGDFITQDNAKRKGHCPP